MATFKGSNDDYNAAYIACAEKLETIDPDAVFGGIAAANQIRHNEKFPLQPSCEDTLLEAAKQGKQMDFLSYHSITTSPGADQIQVMISLPARPQQFGFLAITEASRCWRKSSHAASI